MKNFNKRTFIIVTIVFGLLLIPCWLAAFGEDEGTLQAPTLWIVFAKLFYILRFPTHTFLWTIVSKGGAAIYFGGLFINCLFYGLLTERIITLLKSKSQPVI
jgi:hypothetical protein